MDKFKKILFFADSTQGVKTALKRAMELARHNRASITIMDVVAHVGTDDPRLDESIRRLQYSLIDERKQELHQWADSTGIDTPADTLVISGDKAYIDVINTVISGQYDLLIKAADHENVITAALFGTNDFHLLRQCPTPVWIIKPGHHKRIATVLAAVDMTTDAPGTAQLSRRILEIATSIAQREDAQVHALTTWHQPFDSTIKKRLEVETWEGHVDRYKEYVRQRFDRLLKQFPDMDIEPHILRGTPSTTITRFAADYDVDLLVMGTISREGIPGFLIGNTAERVLNHVDCSVLTLKPLNFKASI